MKDKLIKTEYDEYYEGDKLITIKIETYLDQHQNSYQVKQKRVEGYRNDYCGCSGDQETVLCILEPFTVIEWE